MVLPMWPLSGLKNNNFIIKTKSNFNTVPVIWNATMNEWIRMK